MLPIRGTANEPLSTVNVNGSPATVGGDNSFEGRAAVTAGDNMVTVEATDVNGNTTTNHYNVAATGSGSKTLVYDPNGNLLSLTDALEHTTSYTYNNMDGLASRTDALGHSQAYSYDLIGKVRLVVDRPLEV